MTPTVIVIAAPALATFGSAVALRRLGVSAKRLEIVLAAAPHLAPPVVAGRRAWTNAHLEPLHAEIARRDARGGKRATKTTNPETKAC